MPATATTNDKNGAATQRMNQASAWLLQGIRPREAVLMGVAAWGVQKRMAQLYVAKAKDRLFEESLNKNVQVDLSVTQDLRLRAARDMEAVVKDPNADVAQKRVMIAYVGTLRGILADYDKNAILSAQFRSSMAPSEDAMVELQGVLEEIEKSDDEEDVALGRAAASDQEPEQAMPVPEADEDLPVEELEAEGEEDELIHGLDDLLEDRPEPSEDGPEAQTTAETQLVNALVAAVTSGDLSLSDILEKTHCAAPAETGSATGRSRMADLVRK